MTSSDRPFSDFLLEKELMYNHNSHCGRKFDLLPSSTKEKLGDVFMITREIYVAM